MNYSAIIFATLFTVQFCSLCQAGVIRDKLDNKDLLKESPDHQEETSTEARTSLDDKQRDLSSEEETLESEESEEEQNELRPVRSPVFSETGLDSSIADTGSDGRDNEVHNDDEDLTQVLNEEESEEDQPKESKEANEDVKTIATQ